MLCRISALHSDVQLVVPPHNSDAVGGRTKALELTFGREAPSVASKRFPHLVTLAWRVPDRVCPRRVTPELDRGGYS